jgi:chemotaxis protein histidine kinase CheA
MDQDEAQFRKKFEAIQQGFIAELPDKRRAIDKYWRRLQQDWQPADREALYNIVHRLAGAGETFGFADLSGRARAVDEILRSLEHGEAPAEAERRHLQQAVEELLALMAQLEH